MADDTRWMSIGDYLVLYNPHGVAAQFALSPRETETLTWFAVGATSRQIKREMGISDSTLNTFKRRIVAKMGVNSITSATALFLAAATGARIRHR